MRPTRCFRHVVPIAIARGHGEQLIPFHYAFGPALRTEPLEFRISVFDGGSFSARLESPGEHFTAPLFGIFVEAHPDEALRNRINSFADRRQS